MFSTINGLYTAAKKNLAARKFILESVLEVEEVIPGSDDEMDEVIDVDSIPPEAYKALDAALDKIIDKEGYDDSEIEEMIEGDDDDDEGLVSDADLNMIIDECWAGALD